MYVEVFFLLRVVMQSGDRNQSAPTQSKTLAARTYTCAQCPGFFIVRKIVTTVDLSSQGVGSNCRLLRHVEVLKLIVQREQVCGCVG